MTHAGCTQVSSVACFEGYSVVVSTVCHVVASRCCSLRCAGNNRTETTAEAIVLSNLHRAGVESLLRMKIAIKNPPVVTLVASSRVLGYGANASI
jgi:hypothetical protein